MSALKKILILFFTVSITLLILAVSQSTQICQNVNALSNMEDGYALADCYMPAGCGDAQTVQLVCERDTEEYTIHDCSYKYCNISVTTKKCVAK